MDELLYERVKQLKAVDDWLFMLARWHICPATMRAEINRYRGVELADMVREAERQHADF